MKYFFLKSNLGFLNNFPYDESIFSTASKKTIIRLPRSPSLSYSVERASTGTHLRNPHACVPPIVVLRTVQQLSDERHKENGGRDAREGLEARDGGARPGGVRNFERLYNKQPVG